LTEAAKAEVEATGDMAVVVEIKIEWINGASNS